MNSCSTVKIYRSIILAWIIAMSWTIAFQKPWIALSITLGTVLSTASLVVLQLVVKKAFVPGFKKPVKRLMLVAVVKYILIGILLYFVVRWDRISLPAFCGGIFLVHFALLARQIGVQLAEHLQKENSSRAMCVNRGKEN